ncbi:hypothetical protein ACOCJ7_03725 [Knoellia sp. CPCC 206453]|uniref:hypothetical protein n=1 Tax=Knoellia pratensis TaxID=3404796 RepID=UPI0036095D4F
MTPRACRVLTIGAIIGALALTGCSGSDGDGNAKPETSSSDQGASGGVTKDPGADARANGAKATGIDLKNPPKAIASITVPGAPKGEVTDTLVELVKFEERGKVLLAVYRVTPHGTKEETSLQRALTWRPNLIDPVNLKLYEAVAELTTGFLGDLVMNEPNYVMAGFAVPQNTDTIDVGVSHDGVRMEGVKLP